MNIYRILVGFLALLLPLTPLLSQEAVERTREEETADILPEPSAEPEKAVEQQASTKKERSPKREQSASALQDSMTAAEFKAAGLDKLSADELQNLNDWLQGYRKKAETKASEKATAEATKKAAAQPRPKIDRVESRVAGTLDRLTGRSIITLEDGTKWKQANPEDRYRAQVPDHPTASVSRGPFGWKMRISGLPEIYVDPVRE